MTIASLFHSSCCLILIHFWLLDFLCFVLVNRVSGVSFSKYAWVISWCFYISSTTSDYSSRLVSSSSRWTEDGWSWRRSSNSFIHSTSFRPFLLDRFSNFLFFLSFFLPYTCSVFNLIFSILQKPFSHHSKLFLNADHYPLTKKYSQDKETWSRAQMK